MKQFLNKFYDLSVSTLTGRRFWRSPLNSKSDARCEDSSKVKWRSRSSSYVATKKSDNHHSSRHSCSHIVLATPLRMRLMLNTGTYSENFILSTGIFCQDTCKKVLPSSRKRLNGTSASSVFRRSTKPFGVRNCAPDTAHIGVLTPENFNIFSLVRKT